MKKIKVYEQKVIEDCYLSDKDIETILSDWLRTEKGKFIDQYKTGELQVKSFLDINQYLVTIQIFAMLEEKYEMFWVLKYS
jgi:hypothetical protein